LAGGDLLLDVDAVDVHLVALVAGDLEIDADRGCSRTGGRLVPG
jgi:hypothetical protein